MLAGVRISPTRACASASPSAAAQAGGAAPATPVLRLVEITPPFGVDISSQIDFRPNESCFAIRARGLVREIKSYCFEDLPLEIRPGEPFTITMDARIRHQFPDGHRCSNRPAAVSVLGYGHLIGVRLEGSSLEFSVRGTADRGSYCDEGLVDIDRKEATDKDDAVRPALRSRPAGASQAGWLYDAQPSTNGMVLSRKLPPPETLFRGPKPEFDIQTVEGVVLKYSDRARVPFLWTDAPGRSFRARDPGPTPQSVLPRPPATASSGLGQRTSLRLDGRSYRHEDCLE